MSSNLATTPAFCPTSAYGFSGFWKKSEITQHGLSYLDAKIPQLVENLELFKQNSEDVATQEKIFDRAFKNYDEITNLAKSILIISDQEPLTDDEKETIRQINIRINRISTSLLPNLESLLTRQKNMQHRQFVKNIDDNFIKTLKIQGLIAIPLFAVKMMSDSSTALKIVALNVVLAAIFLYNNIHRKKDVLDRIENLKKDLEFMLSIPTLPETLIGTHKLKDSAPIPFVMFTTESAE